MQCRAREEWPGRKTDLLDAEWLVHLLECGLLRGWFIPPADIKAARDVIRYRRKLVEHRTSKLQRLGNVLQDAGIKADSVASSVTTKSVRAMVGALIDGERRPAVLADLVCGSMRSKIPDLQRAVPAPIFVPKWGLLRLLTASSGTPTSASRSGSSQRWW
ncbi:IS110 family transposase [Mycobacterium canetti]|uniref:IS110 family transposase n=1 Tax=Mycobacterium canetti TaxID=78331 RepID=UPI001E4566B1|nr:transposase [Mycobacterium canetti]